MSDPRAYPSQSRTHSIQSRQSNHSVASTSSKSERDKTKQQGHPAVESAVTRLLVSIKQLLESLTSWSQGKVDENYISDVYVRLGNEFNAAVAAFSAFSIDMGELLTVPDDLRNVLEQCLAEDATSDNLEIYLPTVRSIITNLLTGLRGKQSQYRRIISDNRRSEGSLGHERAESTKSHRSSRKEQHRSLKSNKEGDRPDSISRRSGTSSSRKELPPQNGDYYFIGGFSPSVTGEAAQFPAPEEALQSTSSPPLPPQTQPPPPEHTPTPPPQISTTTVTNGFHSPPPPMISPEIKRYSLSDPPMQMQTPPPVVIEPSTPVSPEPRNGTLSPSPDTPPIESPPAVANSLAALKSDVLERRASKRFSTYNISRMTGGRSGRNNSNRRSLAVGSALTPGELAVLTEADDEGTTSAASPSVRRTDSGRGRRSVSRGATPDTRIDTPPVPPLPVTPQRVTPEPTIRKETLSPQPTAVPPPPEVSKGPHKIAVYLQLGREVKKVVIEPGLSFSSLRVLFVDRFSYNPGLENFPAIYIRDPHSGVQYELEDIEEVREGCLLSLNIEPLDQIKQHVESQITGISQEIKELKNLIVSSNRPDPPAPPNIVGLPLAESTPAAPRPTDKQFQNVARRLSRFVANSSSPLAFGQATSPPAPPFVVPQITGQSLTPQMTGGSVLSDYSGRVMTDLKTQFDEVQNLRRDLGIMRQLYTTFMKDTKESLDNLRNQTKSVKQLASANVGGAREYIDSGKRKLDQRSQNVLTEVEKLQDLVEGIKEDVIKRQVTHKPHILKSIKKDIDTTAAELESLKEHIKTIKPMWKKTWEEELQNIVEEQQFLTHQEEFLMDLLEDHKAVLEVYGHVEKIINLRGVNPGGGRGRSRGFKPPPPDEGHTGLGTVMLEIRGANVDPEKRMKAIEASQRSRQKELAARSDADEMKMELSDFVVGKKLKMTGGAEEAERVRQKRDEQTLKAMLKQEGGGGTPLAPQMTGGSFASDGGYGFGGPSVGTPPPF
ncbi:AIP3-domain-containing protein [Pluteus cervinus]|uniref:AIP3-domain-containing protein n=1 Tax=Pluteus cervinus TaxID=181527 RepID=A0ACD3AZT1_9AGAR|nr:AIP3-domain-containing protein [Pluteus cervinus]